MLQTKLSKYIKGIINSLMNKKEIAQMKCAVTEHYK